MENQIVSPIKKTRYCSIDIFRLYVFTLTILQHSYAFWDIHPMLSYVFPRMMSWVVIPFFASSSSYFYLKKLLAGQPCFKKYVTNILRMYASWSGVYFVILLIERLQSGSSLFSILGKSVINFFFYGTYYHLWFLPAIIISACIVTLAHRYKLLKPLAWFSILLFVIGCLSCEFYIPSVRNVPFFNWFFKIQYFDAIRNNLLYCLPYFLIGYFLNIYEDKFKKLPNKITIPVTVAMFAIWLAEVFVVNRIIKTSSDIMMMSLMVYPVTLCIMVVLLNNPMPKYTKLADFGRGITFFGLCLSELVRIVLRDIGNYIFKVNIEHTTPLALATLLVTILISYVVYKSDVKFIKKYFC